jgi:4-hydroxyacetophenone monooxygenase
MTQQTADLPFTHRVDKAKLRPDELRAHLKGADAGLMLASLVQVTADPSLLERYADRIGAPAPIRAVPGMPAAKATPAEVHAELVELLCAALAEDDQPEYLGIDERALYARLADLVAGVHVDDKYLDMYREQAGFAADQRAVPPTKTPPPTLNIAIIGAGMTGLDAAVKAAARGFSYEVFDLESGIGGLWWTQTYPGVGVDTPSMYYSLSYEVTPDWSNYFPQGAEYRAYLTELATKYRVTEHVTLDTEITRLEWIEADQVWELTAVSSADHTRRTVRAAAVITAAGHLNRPKYPDVAGRETFAGVSVHTARWKNDLDLAGKRVGVVGVGAAGVQVISAIAGQVEHLTVFQRQPHWIMPNMVGDGVVSDSERWLRRHLPYYLQWSRFRVFWQAGDENGYPIMRVDEEWMKDHLSISPQNEFAMQLCLGYIERTFGTDTELAKKLTPDFAVGGKRPVRDPGDFKPGGYYYALSRPHVDVVTSKLARVAPEGIITADGDLHELDVIIYASGMTLDWLSPIEIIGRDGRRLADVWADDNPRSYLGGTVPGFPNLFINDGPNTGVGHAGGHNFMAETVDHYAFECLQLIVEHGARSIEVTQEAHDAHNECLEEVMLGSIWSHEHNAHTYYRNERGRIILPSPWRLVEYWEMSQHPIEENFVVR